MSVPDGYETSFRSDEPDEPAGNNLVPLTHPAGADDWLENAADLRAEPDPGATPFVVEVVLVEGAVAQLVGPPKKGKTYLLLDLAIAIATGGKALGRFSVPNPGPVLIVLEESGWAALHRRLDSLVRGRAIKPEKLRNLHYSANRRVKLDDPEWQARLRATCSSRDWRLVAFDPYARLKGSSDEDSQKESGPVLDFLRELRDLSGGTVLYNAHTGHEGNRQRGSSDFESYYESKLTLTETSGKRRLSTDHREAEGTGPYELSFRLDGATRTLRIDADEDELARKVREHLEQHPDASANAVIEAIGGNRTRVLELVKEQRPEGGSEPPEPPGTTPTDPLASGARPPRPHVHRSPPGRHHRRVVPRRLARPRNRRGAPRAMAPHEERARDVRRVRLEPRPDRQPESVVA